MFQSRFCLHNRNVSFIEFKTPLTHIIVLGSYIRIRKNKKGSFIGVVSLLFPTQYTFFMFYKQLLFNLSLHLFSLIHVSVSVCEHTHLSVVYRFAS